MGGRVGNSKFCLTCWTAYLSRSSGDGDYTRKQIIPIEVFNHVNWFLYLIDYCFRLRCKSDEFRNYVDNDLDFASWIDRSQVGLVQRLECE